MLADAQTKCPTRNVSKTQRLIIRDLDEHLLGEAPDFDVRTHPTLTTSKLLPTTRTQSLPTGFPKPRFVQSLWASSKHRSMLMLRGMQVKHVFFFPTCQVRVVRFYQDVLLLLLPSFSSCSSAGPQLQVLGRSEHRRTSTASSGPQWYDR